MNAPVRTITIAPEPFGAGFDVKIVPPPEGPSLDTEFVNLRVARGYASGLRMIHGWPIVDRIGDEQ